MHKQSSNFVVAFGVEFLFVFVILWIGNLVVQSSFFIPDFPNFVCMQVKQYQHITSKLVNSDVLLGFVNTCSSLI